MHDMDMVEKIFGSKVKDVKIEELDEPFENKQLKFIYNHLKQINSFKKMNENELINEIELSRWGHNYEVIPKNMLLNSRVSFSYFYFAHIFNVNKML